MPIKRRSKTIKKTTYVYIDDRHGLQVKTPPACNRWSQDFRLRIVRDHVAPRTLRSLSDHKTALIRANNQDTIYNVERQALRVVNPVEIIGDKGYIVVLRTDVVNTTTGKRLFLNHSDPAMRMLMVYSFLTGELIGGVPDLQIADVT